ncbi:putative small ubiquitin-related modifier 4 protein [Corchorus olitorius]|uniref:Small ubiquitin-related modifier 4 protein n=1 Tax=Corchorus olitorius TaxID=93759 RepID=A0A1R3IZF3_9ROSI|nr:putative small ubiquitin-related modifier 4 protein [Corchorus olitorius]
MEMSQKTVATESPLITLPNPVKEEKRILLKVKGPNEADHFSYWMTRNTTLLTLMKDYTKRIGVTFNSDQTKQQKI